MVLDRKNQLFPRKKMVLDRKTNFFLGKKWFWEGKPNFFLGKTKNPKTPSFETLCGKMFFLVFPRKKMVLDRKPTFPRKRWFWTGKPTFPGKKVLTGKPTFS